MRRLLLALIVLLPTLDHACAAPSASDLLSGFNALVSGNFSTGHDVEGKVVVGGNLAGNGSFLNLGAQLGVSLSGYGAVNVYGNAGTAHFNANGLTVNIGGANQGSSFSGAAGVQYGVSLPVPAASIFGTLTTLSAGLDALTATTPTASLPTSGSNNAVLRATPGTINGFANVAVIDIAASLLGSYTGVSVNPNGADTVIVNVSGDFTGRPNFQNGAAWRGNVIWNFVDATSVNLGSQGIQGTVLAPFATVINGNPIDGSLFAAAYNGNGELHAKPFAGNGAFLNSFGGGGGAGANAAAIPEPASLALLGVGLGGLAALRRRRH